MTDQYSDEQSDQPSKRQKHDTSTSRFAVGQTTHNVEQDGYGKHNHPTAWTIPIPMTTSHIHGEIVRSIWINMDFSNTDNKQYIVPYQLLQFWTGLDSQENNSLQLFNKLSAAAYGITWYNFTLSIYNQATTRKRLLTQGSATYETIDFETSQNLLVLTGVNNTNTPSVVWPNEFHPPGRISRGTESQSGTNYCKLEEIATGTTKDFSFTPEQLPGKLVREMTTIDSSGLHSDKMFPARQHTTDLQAFDMPLTINHPHNFSSLPLICIDSPHILSEAGNMKFIYRTRWDFKIPYTMHTYQAAPNEKSFAKFIVPYPKAKPSTAKTGETSLQFYAVPTYHKNHNV
jgi:hypothetical protein